MPTHGFLGRLRRCAPRRPARSTSPAAWSLRLGPRVAPAKAVPPAKMLVEMVHVPAHVVRPVLLEHPVNLIHRNPLGRRFAKPLVDQALKPFFFVALPIAPELPLRATQKLAGLQRRQIPPFPSAQYVPKLLH